MPKRHQRRTKLPFVMISMGVSVVIDKGQWSTHRRNVSALDNPRCQKFGESVTPNVLVDRDSNHKRAGDWLVAVDCIRGDHGGKCGDLNASFLSVSFVVTEIRCLGLLPQVKPTTTIAGHGHLCSYPNATTKLPSIMIRTYGTIPSLVRTRVARQSC